MNRHNAISSDDSNQINKNIIVPKNIERYININQDKSIKYKNHNKKRLSRQKSKSDADTNTNIDTNTDIADIDVNDNINFYINPIIEFIQNTDNTDIQKWLDFVLTRHGVKNCDSYIGSGYFGNVVMRKLGKTVKIKYQNKNVVIPIVIKTVNTSNRLEYKEIDNTLYVYDTRGMNIEAIILYFIRPLILLKLSPNLPLIIGHGKCFHDEPEPVDRIITEMHGLLNDVVVNIKGLYNNRLWQDIPFDEVENENGIIEKRFYKLSKFGTLSDLIINMQLNINEDDTVELPNGIKCNFVELIDYLTISYLVTYDLLAHYDIHLNDMIAENIFIHWLNKNSYINDEFIGNVEHIFYDIDGIFYKIKTFGLLLKIGDVGACIINPKKELILVGYCRDIEYSNDLVNKLLVTPLCHVFLLMIASMLSYNIYKKTIIYKILSDTPYCNLTINHVSDKYKNNLLTGKQLLHKFFQKYSINKIDEKKNFLSY